MTNKVADTTPLICHSQENGKRRSRDSKDRETELAGPDEIPDGHISENTGPFRRNADALLEWFKRKSAPKELKPQSPLFPPERQTFPRCYLTGRLINRATRKFNVSVRGIPIGWRIHHDVFHLLQDLKWWKLAFVLFVYYGFMIWIFAMIYWMPCIWGEPSGVSSENIECSFWDSYFFSTEVMSTIGFGRKAPTTYRVSAIVFVESWVSIVSCAAMGAIMYHKLSRSSRMRASILYSKHAILTQDTEGNTVFRFQICNMYRRHLEVANVRLYYFEHLSESPVSPTHPAAGDYVKYNLVEMDYNFPNQVHRIRHLALPNPLLSLPSQITHVIGHDSPLKGATTKSLRDKRAEILCCLDCLDEASSETVQVRYSYNHHDIVFNGEFLDCLIVTNHGYEVDVDRFQSLVLN